MYGEAACAYSSCSSFVALLVVQLMNRELSTFAIGAVEPLGVSRHVKEPLTVIVLEDLEQSPEVEVPPSEPGSSTARSSALEKALRRKWAAK